MKKYSPKGSLKVICEYIIFLLLCLYCSLLLLFHPLSGAHQFSCFSLRIIVLFFLHIVIGLCHGSMTIKERNPQFPYLWLLSSCPQFIRHLVARMHSTCTLFILFIHYLDWSMVIVLLPAFIRGNEIRHSPKVYEYR